MPDVKDPPSEVALVRREITRFFSQKNDQGRRIGSSNCGVYAFFDYDGEPIYVGQSIDTLQGRVGRHLTGRRSDAVAKFVLDPFEVLEIEVWPFWMPPDPSLSPRQNSAIRKGVADRLEYAIYEKCVGESRFQAVLNEGDIHPADHIDLPTSYRHQIIPESLYEERRHPDIRIARRAATIASLARLISERKVGRGLRKTLRVQAQRLEYLTAHRYIDFAGEADDDVAEGE